MKRTKPQRRRSLAKSEVVSRRIGIRPPAISKKSLPRRKWFWQGVNSIATWDGWTKLGAVVAVVALWYTGQSLIATQRQVSLTESAQHQDRYLKATERAMSEDSAARLLGIAELESIAKVDPAEAERVRLAVGEVLRKIIRKNANCSNGASAHEPKDVLYAASWLVNHHDGLNVSGALKPMRDGTRLTIQCVERAGVSEEAPSGVLVSINLARLTTDGVFTDFTSILV